MTSLTTNWSHCCFCQTTKKETLRFARNVQDHHKHHLEELATNIAHFESIAALPFPLNPKRLNNGKRIVQTLIENNACYHVACKLLFTNYKVERAKSKCDSLKIYTWDEI